MAKSYQQVLLISTEDSSLRSEVVGWGGEDPRLFVPGKPIGMTPGSNFPMYKTVLEAMADGWHLLSQPQHKANQDYDWWLVRTVTEGDVSRFSGWRDM